MATRITTPFTYTDEEMLAEYRAGLMAIPSTGKGYQIAGRTFNAADLPEMRETITWLEGRIAAASNGPFATNYVRLVRG